MTTVYQKTPGPVPTNYPPLNTSKVAFDTHNKDIKDTTLLPDLRLDPPIFIQNPLIMVEV